MTAPTIRATGASSSGANNTTHYLGHPSGIQDGDLEIAIFGFDCGLTPTAISSGMSGWTLLFSDTNNGFQPTVYCYYKTGVAAEAGTIFPVTTVTAEMMAGVIFAIDGADSGELYSNTTYAPDPPFNAPVVTMGSVQDYLVLTGLFLNRTSGIDVTDYPTGFTDLFGTYNVTDVAFSIQHASVSASSVYPTGAFGTSGLSAWKVVNLAGADPTAEKDADYYSFTIAIAPATGQKSHRFMLLGVG